MGDTLSAGGIFYAQRTIPVLLDICRDIRELAKPGALFINYSNPMAMNTWACNEFGGVQTIGLCHGVQHAHKQMAELTQQWARREGVISQDDVVTTSDIDFTAAGLNHQTWFVRVNWRGRDMLPLLLDEWRTHPEYSQTEKVRADVWERFGYFSTESNGHLSEYLPYYRKRPEEVAKWIHLGSWIHGETGGYLRVCTEGRNWFEEDFPNWMAETAPDIRARKRSIEHGSFIIEGLETGRIYRGHFNVPNRGQITNLPNRTIIEVPGYVDRNGISIPVVGDLPLACAATCSVSARVQEMTMLAAVHGDVKLLKQAMLHDPLVGAVCNPEEVWQMTDEMLIALAPWLPQYAAEVPKAKERLAAHDANGTRVLPKQGIGLTRQRTKSIEELRLDKEAAKKNAAAAAK